MFATLEAKVIAAVALLLIAVCGFAAYTFYERHKGATVELAKMKSSSDALLAAANAKIATLTADHAKQVAAIIGVIDNERKANAVSSASDAERLREYDAYRRQHPAVASAGGGPANQGAGANSAGQGEDFVSELGQAGVSLAGALRDSGTALNACTVERDGLTGKP